MSDVSDGFEAINRVTNDTATKKLRMAQDFGFRKSAINPEDIWQTLKAEDVTPYTETKANKFTYLSWMKAWSILKKHYPEATFSWRDSEFHQDGTVTVGCVVFCGNFNQTCTLPVLTGANQAIKNPNAFDINRARMRCLVKCLAFMGLGSVVYGDNVRHEEDFDRPEDYQPASQPERHQPVSQPEPRGPLADAATVAKLEAGLDMNNKDQREWWARCEKPLTEKDAQIGLNRLKAIEAAKLEAEKDRLREELNNVAKSMTTGA